MLRCSNKTVRSLVLGKEWKLNIKLNIFRQREKEIHHFYDKSDLFRASSNLNERNKSQSNCKTTNERKANINLMNGYTFTC